ncbi:hypothetical protein HGG76_15710 [Ochrobactrum tritici]|uniref:Uncharacterized protein n=1 Tax=Brucella tritici TaxID=94626 RepID=A0A7X6FR00_9HYPH|nr:hypothetical protein [Brucella tritici]
MSLYLKSWLFTCWIVALIFTISYWLPLFEQLPEPLGLIAGFAFFVGHALAMLYGFYCPECGLSVYQSKRALSLDTAQFHIAIAGIAGAITPARSEMIFTPPRSSPVAS